MNVLNEVFAKSLPDRVSDVAVKRYFSRFGEVLNVSIRTSKDGNRTFGFIKFDSIESCRRCVDASPIIIDEKRVYVLMSNKNGQTNGAMPAGDSKSNSRSVNDNTPDDWDDTGAGKLGAKGSSLSEAGSRQATGSNSLYQQNVNGYSHQDKSDRAHPLLTNGGGSSCSSSNTNLAESRSASSLSGASVCVTFADRFSGLLYVQTANQRNEMFAISRRIAEIARYDRSGISRLPADGAQKGTDVVIQVRKHYYRAQLTDLVSDNNSDCKVRFLDIGKKGSNKSQFVYLMPQGVQFPAHPLCTAVQLDDVDKQDAITFFRNLDRCSELFGCSINIFQPDDEVKWFVAVLNEQNFGSPKVKLMMDGECLNSRIDKVNQKSTASDNIGDHYQRGPSYTTGSTYGSSVASRPAPKTKVVVDDDWSDGESVVPDSEKLMGNLAHTEPSRLEEDSQEKVTPQCVELQKEMGIRLDRPLKANDAALSKASSITKATTKGTRFQVFVKDLNIRLFTQNAHFVFTYSLSFKRICLCPGDVMVSAIEISEEFDGVSRPEPTDYPEVGELVMARYEADGAWYRGEVLSVDRSSTGCSVIAILFIDFGNVERMQLSNCRYLRSTGEDKHIIELSYGLVQCELTGNWKGRSLEQFAEFALNKTYQCQFEHVDGAVLLTSAIDNAGVSMVDLLNRVEPGSDSMAEHDNSDKNVVVNGFPTDQAGSDEGVSQLYPPTKSLASMHDSEFVKPLEVAKPNSHCTKQRTKLFQTDMEKRSLAQGDEYTLTHAYSFNKVYLIPNDVMFSVIQACQLYGTSLKSVKENNCFEQESPSVNEIVMAKYDADDSWYRGEVRSVDKVAGTVIILFIDFGNVECLSMRAIRCLEKKDDGIFQIPFGLIECSLQGDWSGKRIEQFSAVALNRTYKCHFESPQPGLIVLTSAIDSCNVNILDLRETLKSGSDSTKPQFINNNCNQSEGDSFTKEESSTSQIQRALDVGREPDKCSALSMGTSLSDDVRFQRICNVVDALKTRVESSQKLMRQMGNQLDMQLGMLEQLGGLINAIRENGNRCLN